MVVDLPLGSDEECVKQRVEAWKRWPRGQQLKIHLGDSQASEADAAVKSAINKWGIGKFDMVFIDAGHKYEEVKADYERYAQYAKKLIAFHGIQPSKVLAAEDFGVDRFWKEVKQDRPSIEIVASETYGIGVLPLI